MTIPFIDFSGAGEELVFLHANGYPPECYRPLLLRLAEQYHVTAMLQRPLWTESRPEDIEDWLPLADDFLHFLETHQTRPIACVGHSMGGTTLLRAALREPKWFKAIVLLDPVLFPPYYSPLWSLLYKSRLGYRLHPIITTAKKRRQEFDDLDRLFKGFRRKSIFRYMDDEALQAYVEGITCKTDKGSYQLCYSAEWETRLYITAVWRDMDIWRGLPKLQVPLLIIRGVETNTFWERTGKLVKRKQPRVKVEALERSTHLLPLERPLEVSTIIQSF
ncbi:MAG: alpha/beta hydrolase, partial [Anaerolineales bacterium]|nr:alpha/beta hydrolase [Anaerolineales bacterium]